MIFRFIFFTVLFVGCTMAGLNLDPLGRGATRVINSKPTSTPKPIEPSTTPRAVKVPEKLTTTLRPKISASSTTTQPPT